MIDIEALAARVSALEASQARFVYVADDAEIDSQIPVTQAGTTAWRWIHRMTMPWLHAGDLLLIVAGCEVRNDAGYNVEFVDQFLLCPQWPYYNHDNEPGSYMIGDISGWDQDPMGHYWRPQRVEVFQMPADMPSAYLHYRGRCRSDASRGNEHCTIMQPGYGRMSALVIKGGLR